MKILRIQPRIDNSHRYNYKVNYGVWDCIDCRTVSLENLKSIQKSYINEFDVVFLPMYKRWQGHIEQLNRLKMLNVKTVLFDNDSCYRSFMDPFYYEIDFVFYRIRDKDGKRPLNSSRELLWSVDTNYFSPVYGGNGVSFNCTVKGGTYSLREQIAKHIKPTNYSNHGYVEHLQRSGAAIHTNSEIAPIPRAKILEFAACGTQIISNRTNGMNNYFEDELITYFDSVDELLNIVSNFKPNISIQKKLRKFVEEKHSDKVRAKEVIGILQDKFKIK